jgi:carbonic anhydrase
MLLALSNMHLSTTTTTTTTPQTARPIALPLPIRGRAALLTCMHGELDCGRLVGARAHELPIIRNPGARVTDDAVRSLLLAYEVFGAQRWFLVQHSDCGMALLNPEVTEKLCSGVGNAQHEHALTRHDRAGSVQHATLGRLLLEDRRQILAADLTRLRAHPLLPHGVSIHGYFYDLTSGLLSEVAPQ